jgi:hypothetical protein
MFNLGEPSAVQSLALEDVCLEDVMRLSIEAGRSLAVFQVESLLTLVSQ